MQRRSRRRVKELSATAYLLARPINAARLRRAIADANAGKGMLTLRRRHAMRIQPGSTPAGIPAPRAFERKLMRALDLTVTPAETGGAAPGPKRRKAKKTPPESAA